MAREHDLDLVEVAPNAKPPVCKIMDFGKFKYEEQKKLQAARKKQSVVQIKEVKVRPKTDEHDFQTKLRHARRFLEAGDRCKVTVFFRGREIVHKDRGLMILQRMVDSVSDLARVEQQPRSEGRTMSLLLSPLTKKQ
ncbi:bacterial translation initiation factor 3 (bIF-3) [Desulfobaculum bizertense DSM 18034]|uniref:Translation initiation factor IF-3 n=2 Tax=Desulfobaculum TaxID=1433996 RepID=A0A1T4WBV8_9BACT|nr:bacterial translation initiation factor 3 (bIF-3) [Desulfobaculum bizertense DSM 18034]